MLVGGRLRLNSLSRIYSIQQAFTFTKSVVAASSKPKILVKPAVSLIDEKIELDVVGLAPKQRLTLHAKLTGDKGESFESFAHYIADEHGTVSVSSQPSVGGSYTGTEPMGLLWSMEPSPGQKRGIRLLKRDVTKPHVVSVDVFDGYLHLGRENESVDEPISSGTFEKWYMKDGVKRIPVREGRIRGTLFLPPGDGPFPGVMEFLGSAGGLYEFKAALLASHGFAVLSLAFFAYEDLPKTLDQVELEYFEEAARILLQNPCVSQHRIGLFAISKGSEIALTLAAHRGDIIKAVVAVSPGHALYISPLLHRGNPLEFVTFDPSKIKQTESGDVCIKDCLFTDADSPAVIPVEQINCPVYLVYGSGDLVADAPYEVERIQLRMDDHGKGSLCTVSGYPNAGHLIEPPYTPLCHTSYHKVFGVTMVHGGEPKAHAVAQEDSWHRSLEFLRKHLSSKYVKSHL